ncbi:hypothetical protein CRENBAI_007227 [Crenichthys baileyi]|uniref:Uncharacterized protein n=1 Tax=Crenichthys baileyi TaxID=28760 RepID=A0AAV9RKG4_9TELE
MKKDSPSAVSVRDTSHRPNDFPVRLRPFNQHPVHLIHHPIPFPTPCGLRTFGCSSSLVSVSSSTTSNASSHNLKLKHIKNSYTSPAKARRGSLPPHRLRALRYRRFLQSSFYGGQLI